MNWAAIMILGSLQAHASKSEIGTGGGICPTIGTTDFSLPKIIEKRMNEDVKTIVEGMLSDGKWQKMHEQSRRVYSIDGIAPTLHTCGGGILNLKLRNY